MWEHPKCFHTLNGSAIQSKAAAFSSFKDWINYFPLCHIWSLGWRYKDIKFGQKDKYSGARSAWPAFYFSVKRSWEWFSHWWSFQWRSSQFSAALPTTTNPSLFPGFSPYPGATRIRPRGRQGGQKDQQELVCGWQCQGIVEGREKKKRKVGGHSGGRGRGRIYQQIEWNMWFRLQSGGGGVGKRAKGWRGREYERQSMSGWGACGL